MQALKERLGAIPKLFPAGARLAYLDYPVHENVGDLLIMLGTERFFRDYRLDVRYRASAFNFRPPNFLRDPTSVVICHGGGNFGDLYPTFHSFRESIVRRYPANRIVVLPQTVHFEDPERLRASKAVFGGHRDLHLLVRDEESFRIAREHFSDNVYLVPDMAHQLWPVSGVTPRAAKGSDRELLLIRRDGEGTPLPETIERRAAEFRDWKDLLKPTDWYLLYAAVWAQRLDRRLGNTLPAGWAWRRYAGMLVARGIRLFAGYERIVTSRLHGHILACLMAKPSVLLDNSYGKNSSYYRTWTSGIGAARLA
jgi:pyruvyl transferase EpsO